jgi:hypothetical protein
MNDLEELQHDLETSCQELEVLEADPNAREKEIGDLNIHIDDLLKKIRTAEEILILTLGLFEAPERITIMKWRDMSDDRN